jgi:hypothetical protein
MDHAENLIGFLEIYGSWPNRLRSIRWYNSERSRSYSLFSSERPNTKKPGEKGFRRYQAKRQEPCAEIFMQSLPAGYQIQTLLHTGESINTTLEPVAPETVGFYKSNDPDNDGLRYEQMSSRVVLFDGRSCTLKNEEYLCGRHIQNQLNFSELLWIDLPKLEDPVFNLKMKTLVNQYLFQPGCSNNNKDEREHWWHYRKAETQIVHFSKHWISLHLRILNTCDTTPTDTILHVNYFRHAKKFMSMKKITQKINAEGKTLGPCPKCRTKPKGYTLDSGGINIHHGFDLFEGVCHCSMSWEELGYKNLRKWLKSLK